MSKICDVCHKLKADKDLREEVITLKVCNDCDVEHMIVKQVEEHAVLKEKMPELKESKKPIYAVPSAISKPPVDE